MRGPGRHIFCLAALIPCNTHSLGHGPTAALPGRQRPDGAGGSLTGVLLLRPLLQTGNCTYTRGLDCFKFRLRTVGSHILYSTALKDVTSDWALPGLLYLVIVFVRKP